MPQKRGGYKNLRKRVSSGIRKRRARRAAKQVMVNRALQPIPQRYIAKMKYAETITTSALGTYEFNLNSIFDPNRTGLGHQPYGHDTFQTLYNRYRVISCGWRIHFMAQTTSTPITVTSFPGNEVVSFATGAEAKENPRTRYITQNPGAGSTVLKGKQYIPSLVGRNKAQYMADDRYQALMGANPGELAILNIGTYNNGDVAAATTLQVLLEYTVEFFDIKHLAQS